MELKDTQIIEFLNQFHEIERKLQKNPQIKSVQRNLRRLTTHFEDAGYHLHNPIGEKYDETRLDCEATISGSGTDHLTIVEVIKPIIYYRQGQEQTIIQKGIVITEQV